MTSAETGLVFKHESKTRFLDAALHDFRAKGYSATRIEDICEAAGLTAGSCFHHFESEESWHRKPLNLGPTVWKLTPMKVEAVVRRGNFRAFERSVYSAIVLAPNNQKKSETKAQTFTSEMEAI